MADAAERVEVVPVWPCAVPVHLADLRELRISGNAVLTISPSADH